MLIDGKKISEEIKTELKNKVLTFKKNYKRNISLAVILIGENPASKIYVNNKIKACEFVGIKSLSYIFPENVTKEEVLSIISVLNNDSNVDGILVQLPLPKHLDANEILSKIDVNKDVDGFLPENVGNMFLGNPSICSCTPLGIMKLIESTGVDIVGKHAVIIGRSNIVGKPIASLLLNANCTVTICHSKTKNLEDFTLNADIIIVAIGKPKFLKENMVKNGAIIIDVGINRTENGIVGDVDFENLKDKASFITPVPGGVGPMTISMLLYNTYNCALRRNNAVI